MTRRERLVLSLGALTIIGLFGVRSFPPFALERVARMQDSSREMLSVIGRRQGLKESERWIAESLQVRANANEELNLRLLSPMSVANGQSELALLLRTFADGSDISVMSMTMLPDTIVLGNLRQVAVGVEASGDVEGIASFLMAIETDQLLLRVRRLSISATLQNAASSSPPELLGQFTIDALIGSTTEVAVK